MYDEVEILENIAANEEIAKKLFEIEVGILSTVNFKDLFERLLLLIEEKFEIPHVWISMITEDADPEILEALESSELIKKRLNLVERQELIELLSDPNKPALVNEDLGPFYRLFPRDQKYFLKSMAVSPLFLGGDMVGSLNLGDFSGFRFQPNMDTFFLTQLAVKISICLSNVMARERLTYLSTRDPLTGLFNRRHMDDILEQEFERSLRYEAPLALVFIDCDNFKDLNDSFGHRAGDALLKYIADQMVKIIRKGDMVFRYAGDEFVIILPNQTHSQALKVLERLGGFFRENPLRIDDKEVPFTFSFGIASTEDKVKESSELLTLADKRLYGVKQAKG